MAVVKKRRRNPADPIFNYRRYMPDRGCGEATLFKGKQSHCLECPFMECLLIKQKAPARS